MAGADAGPVPWLERVPPALLALAVHLPACGLLLAALVGLQAAGMAVPLPYLFLAEGLLAWALSRWLGLPPWWQAINLLFFPLLSLAGQAEIPPVWYLAGFLILALTSLGSLHTRVPLYLSSQRATAEILARLPARAGLRLVDLGCGLGGPLASIARARPDARLHGVETAPLNWLFCRLRLLGRARVRLGSLWDEDLSRYDAVYAYLSPTPMQRLWTKARAEMRPGSLFISNTFEVPGVPPDEVVELNDLSRARLLIWRMR